MSEFEKFITCKYIYIPLLLWCGIQLFKFLYELVKTRKFNFKRILGSGGMPSSHSAVVSAMATLMGKYQGIDSEIFALSLLVAFVVMYDACGVRRAAGKQAAILNKIIETPGLTIGEVSGKLVELLGHTPIQVFVGAGIGIIVGLLA